MVYIVATHSRGLHDKNNVQVSKLFIVHLCIYIEKNMISNRSLTLLRVHYSRQVIKSIFSKALLDHVFDPNYLQIKASRGTLFLFL